MEYTEEFDKLKTKVLKYIMYKKRTEREVRQKFTDIEQDILEDIIENLKELEYIDDNKYAYKAVNEFMRLNNMSIKELKYKLISKGLNEYLVQDYMEKHREKLEEYELQSAKNIISKKCPTSMDKVDKQEIIQYLIKKGYKKEIIKGAINE